MKKIKLCLYTHKVTVIADYYNNEEYAKEALLMQNDKIVKQHKNLGYNFFFLAIRKKGAIDFVVESTHIKFPVNEARFKEKVEGFMGNVF